jgi:hypothetical protein
MKGQHEIVLLLKDVSKGLFTNELFSILEQILLPVQFKRKLISAKEGINLFQRNGCLMFVDIFFSHNHIISFGSV